MPKGVIKITIHILSNTNITTKVFDRPRLLIIKETGINYSLVEHYQTIPTRMEALGTDAHMLDQLARLVN